MNKLGVKEIETDSSSQTSISSCGLYTRIIEPGKFAVGYKCVTFREDFLKDISHRNRLCRGF